VSQVITHISAYEVIYDLIPKLNTMKKEVNTTLNVVVKTSQTAEQKARYESLKTEFELELTMIRLNLEHLLNRYETELEAVAQDKRRDVYLTLDAHEATAVESAKALYQRLQALTQTKR
jgi:L-alanine-DL-glutamate epimerase-like enolase superfamily enzyme